MLIVIALSAVCQVSAAEQNITDTVSIEDENSIENALHDDSELLSSTYSPKNFTELQNTIENANNGDSIELNGTYEFKEIVNVKKSINIIGLEDGAVIKYNDFNFLKNGFFKIESSASDVVINNLKFVGSTDDANGAVQWMGNNGSMINCDFKGIISVSGGALKVEGANCNIINCSFKNNKVTNGAGAAIGLYGDGSVISNCEFINNEARGENGAGGAVLIFASNCMVENSTFTDNKATGYGGAITIYNKNNKVINSTFRKNHVENNLTCCNGGGAIFSYCNGLIITNCTFEGNLAPEAYGGAVVLGEFNTVENSSFKDNSASSGNDIYANSTSYLFYNHIKLSYKETMQEAVYGEGIRQFNTTVEITKRDSEITFSAGMVFEYGSSGNVHVIVEGGSVEKKNIKVLNHPEAKISFVNNELTVSGLAVGKYTLRITTSPDKDHYSIDKDLPITVNKAVAVIKASKVTVALKKGSYWTIKLVDSKKGNPISNMKLTLKIFTGKKYKKVTIKTNSKGEANYQTKKLTKGKHKVIVIGSHAGYKFNTLTSSINVIKPKKLTFKVKVNNAKDGSSISITTKNKNKPVNGIKIKVLVYTGKKYETVTLKSKTIKGFKGAAGWGTNKLSTGSHKVVVMPASIKYSGSKTVKLNLKKSATKYIAWETKI